MGGACINVFSQQATPLQLACKEGHIKVVDLLIKNGAKVSHCNSAGLNALDVAVESGQKYVHFTT